MRSTLSPTASLHFGRAGGDVVASEDVRGRDVYDPDASRIGTVDDVVVDETSGHVRFLRVVRGGLFGFGSTHYLVPVDAVTDVVPHAVFLSVDRSRMDVAPSQPDVLGDDAVQEICEFYGCEPYWVSGYSYPDWAATE
jgi:sporulation protein YlmC with PRC-barrel domain